MTIHPASGQLYKRLTWLALPAWKRLAFTLPVVAVLWLGVYWAFQEVTPL